MLLPGGYSAVGYSHSLELGGGGGGGESISAQRARLNRISRRGSNETDEMLSLGCSGAVYALSRFSGLERYIY